MSHHYQLRETHCLLEANDPTTHLVIWRWFRVFIRIAWGCYPCTILSQSSLRVAQSEPTVIFMISRRDLSDFPASLSLRRVDGWGR